MAAMDRTTGSAILKRVYRKRVTELVNYKRILSNRLSPVTEKYAEGERIDFALHTADNWGVKITAGINLPNAQFRQHQVGNANYKHIYAQMKITGPMMSSTSQSGSAFLNALENETKGVAKTMKVLDQIALWGDGSGELAALSSTAPTDDATNVTVPVLSTRNCYLGMMCDVLVKLTGITGAGGATNIKITDVDHAGLTIKFASADLPNFASLASTDSIYIQDSYNSFPWGVQAIISTSNPVSGIGNYGGITRTNNVFWQAQDNNNSGTNRAFKLNLLQDLIDDIENRSAGEPDLIVTTPKLWSRMGAMLAESKRYTGKTLKLDGWFDALDFGGIPVAKDKYCPENTMYVFDMGYWYEYQAPDVGSGTWMDKDGAVLARSASEDAYEATWLKYYNTICTAPNAQGVLNDLIE